MKTAFSRTALRGSALTALAVSISTMVPSIAMAQDASEGEDEFIGTVDIGESTRSIQTGTETAVTVVDREEIEDRQASTIAELIDSVPGVTLINGSTPKGSAINIRGFGGNNIYGTDQKVLVQVDGANVGAEEIYRVANQLYTDPLLYRQVEVIRGTVGSFEYGSGAVGGVVRVETVDASDLTGGQPGYAANQVLGYHSNGDGFNTSTTLALAPSEKFEFLANFSYREQNNPDDGAGVEIGNSDFELPSLLLKAGVYFGADNEHSIKLSYNYSESSDRDVPYDTFQTGTDFFGNVDRDTQNEVANLRYNFNPLDNDEIDLELQFSYSNQDIQQEYVPGSSTSPFAPPGGFGVVNADLQYEIYMARLKNAALFNTGSVQHNLRTGVEFIRRERLDASAAPGGIDERLAFFLVDEIELARGLTVTPAIRYETSDVEARPGLNDGSEFSSGFSAWMGGVSARYEFPFGLALFGSWAETEVLPILDDLENPIFREQSEKARTYEFGASYDKIGVASDTDRIALKVNYYDTAVRDITSYSRVAEVDVDGLEIEASYASASGFYVDLNANFVSGTETSATTGAVRDWRNVPQDSFLLSAGQRFNDIFNVRWESLIVRDTTRNGTFEEGFDVHNLRVIVTPDSGVFEDFSLRVSAENLFDKVYQPILSTRNSPGRNIKFTISKLF